MSQKQRKAAAAVRAADISSAHLVKLTPKEAEVGLRALGMVGWEVLPVRHPDRVAAKSLSEKLAHICEAAA